MKPANVTMRRSVRISLKTIFVSALLFFLCLSLWLVSQKLNLAMDELNKRRAELGYVTVADPKNINFISVPQHEENKWRWRVSLPSDRKFHLNFKTIGIADEGFPRPDCVFYVEGGEEFSVAVVCHKNERDEWRVTAMSTTGHSQGLGFLGPTHYSWLEGQSRCTYMVHGKRQTVSVDPTQPAELLRLRIIQPDDVQTNDGILVWIAEVPNGPNNGVVPAGSIVTGQRVAAEP